MPVHSQTCRLCMRQFSSPDLMENIFNSKTITVESIKMVTQIDVVEGDGLPPYACLLCIFMLSDAKNFIKSCIDCNEKLKLLCTTKDLLAGQDNAEDEVFIKTEPKEENDVIDEIDAANISVPVLKKEPKEFKKEVEAEEAINTEYLAVPESLDSGPLNSSGCLDLGQAKPRNIPKQDDRKRKHSASLCIRGTVQKAEDEPELDEAAEVLSWYDSDLNLVIDKADFLSAAPMHINGFGYIWAGARATFGFASGKLAYQTKVEEDLDISHLEKESCPNVLRVGWSVPSASMQLGEEPLSYGFSGTGKASTDCKFKDYGVPFKVGDVVTSYLEWTEEDAVLSFAVNGETHREAYRVSREKLGGLPLFPHVLSKNQRFSVDFGAREEPWFPLDEDFVFVGAAPVESRVTGPRRPEKKEDCEMVMMCGLPGAGKTTWVNKYVAELPDKKFNVLGTNALIDKMRVDGLPRKGNYEGQWEQLIEKCTRCVLKLLEVAAGRRRNYILDQINVYPLGQRRKMRGFEGFVRRAIVIVPTNKDFKSRVAKREALKWKGLSDAAVLEMKANFALPDEGDVFSTVTFVELDRKGSQRLVELYNKEGRAAGYGTNKRLREETSDDREHPAGAFSHRTNGGGRLQPSACTNGDCGINRGGWRGYNQRGSRVSRPRGGRGYGRGRQQPWDFFGNQGQCGCRKGRDRDLGYKQQQGDANLKQDCWSNFCCQAGGYNQWGSYWQQGSYNQQSGRNYQNGNVTQQSTSTQHPAHCTGQQSRNNFCCQAGGYNQWGSYWQQGSYNQQSGYQQLMSFGNGNNRNDNVTQQSTPTQHPAHCTGQQSGNNFSYQAGGYNQWGGYCQQGSYNQQSGHQQQMSYGNGNCGNFTHQSTSTHQTAPCTGQQSWNNFNYQVGGYNQHGGYGQQQCYNQQSGYEQ